MPALDFTLATPADDESLRRLLRENPIPGSLSLTFEREPCYFDASAIEGPFHQTIVAREKDSGQVIAFGNRSVRKLFMNGHPQDIGYMSQLARTSGLWQRLISCARPGWRLQKISSASSGQACTILSDECYRR